MAFFSTNISEGEVALGVWALGVITMCLIIFSCKQGKSTCACHPRGMILLWIRKQSHTGEVGIHIADTIQMEREVYG